MILNKNIGSARRTNSRHLLTCMALLALALAFTMASCGGSECRPSAIMGHI